MGQRGAITASGLLAILLVTLLLYLGYEGGMAFMHHQSMIEELRSRGDDSLLNPRLAYSTMVLARLHEVDSAFEDKELRVEYSYQRDSVAVNFTYDRPMNIFGFKLLIPLTVDFEVNRSADIAKLNNVKNSYENATKAGEERIKNQVE